MKVLHVVHGSPHLDPLAGGTERYAAAVAEAQGATVLARDPHRSDGQTVAGPVPGLFGVGLEPPRDFRGTWSSPQADAAVAACVARTAPDVVHVHHLAHLGFGAVSVARQAGAAVVLTLHDYHLPCARGQLVDRHLDRCPGPALTRCGACLGEHLRASPRLQELGRIAGALGLRSRARGALAAVAPGPVALARVQARLDAARGVLDAADRVLSPSRDLGQRLQDLGWLSADGWHWQDLPLVSALDPAPLPGEGPVRFLFVGHLIPTKGVEVLLDAFERLHTGTLVLRGPFAAYDGQPDWAQRIQTRVDGAARVSWGGPFTAQERQAVYDNADVLVVPSTWEENSPLVVREALAAGLRVVGSAVGGLGELAPGARLVPPGDAAALAGALQAEQQAGRGRQPPQGFPLGRHLSDLDAHYRAALAHRRSSVGGGTR